MHLYRREGLSSDGVEQGGPYHPSGRQAIVECPRARITRATVIRFPGGRFNVISSGGVVMTVQDGIGLAGGVIFLILIVLLIRRAIQDVNRPGM